MKALTFAFALGCSAAAPSGVVDGGQPDAPEPCVSATAVRCGQTSPDGGTWDLCTQPTQGGARGVSRGVDGRCVFVCPGSAPWCENSGQGYCVVEHSAACPTRL